MQGTMVSLKLQKRLAASVLKVMLFGFLVLLEEWAQGRSGWTPMRSMKFQWPTQVSGHMRQGLACLRQAPGLSVHAPAPFASTAEHALHELTC
eukprot:694884-Pelagomonas_calceolata.AAC.1